MDYRRVTRETFFDLAVPVYTTADSICERLGNRYETESDARDAMMRRGLSEPRAFVLRVIVFTEVVKAE